MEDEKKEELKLPDSLPDEKGNNIRSVRRVLHLSSPCPNCVKPGERLGDHSASQRMRTSSSKRTNATNKLTLLVFPY
jgi:hypothetical protein